MRTNKGKVPHRYVHKINENYYLWSKWNGIKKRCLSENDERYADYGGRGIKMYKPWLESFDNFADWAYENGYADDLTIERIDVNGDYCPENCKWIPLKEQAYNKRNTIWVDYNGKHVQLLKLCTELGKNYDMIHNRITKMGWDAEKAIDEPSIYAEESLRHKCSVRGLNYATIRDRIVKLGWTEEEALSIPTGRGRNRQFYSDRHVKSFCLFCGKEYEKITGRQKYCSETCRDKAKKERKKCLND